MQQERLKLKPRLSLPQTPVGEVDTRALVLRAIEGRRCITAIYNRNRIELAPHILYEKHGEPYVDGVVLLRDGAPPRELKLGSFKLTGLGEPAPTLKRFEPQPVFHRSAERYQEAVIASI